MRGRCKEEAGVQIKPGRVTGTEDSVRLELGTRRAGGREILPPLVYMGEPGYNTQPTHARASKCGEGKQADGLEEIKPRHLPEAAMALGKGTLI